jgi:hypothetical protein
MGRRGRPIAIINRHRAEEAVERGYIHCIFEAAVGKQKCVEFLDLPVGQRTGFDQSQADGSREAMAEGIRDHARNGIAPTPSLGFLSV